MKKLFSYCLASGIRLMIFVLFILPTCAQQTDADRDRKTLDSLLSNEHLDTLQGFPVTLYSAGYRARATAIQQLVRNCIQYYQPQYPADKYDVHIEILNEKDWKGLPYPHPYGLPHFTDVNQSIIVSADKNALNRLNNQADQQTDDSIIAGFDYVALHELGHYFFYTLHHVDKDHFLNETMASYFLICYLQHNKLPLGLEKENNTYTPQHKTVDDFNTLYIKTGPQNYDWYQRRFIDLGYLLYPQLKNNLISSVIQNYSPGGKNLDGLMLFKSLAPATVDGWLKGMK